MVTRPMKCAQCGYQAEEQQRLTDPLLTVCPTCKAPSYKSDYSTPRELHFTVSGSHHVNGERRFTRPFVGRERNGGETVYTSEAQMLKSEFERAQGNTTLSKRGRLKFAKKQVETARKQHGLRPGTLAAQHAQAIEAQGRSGWAPPE